MTKEELKAYNEGLIAKYISLFNITKDEYFKVEDLKDWLCAMLLNNEDLSDCITEIIKRLPGFVQYVKDKKEGLI